MDKFILGICIETIVFTGLQIYFAKKGSKWKQYILPCIYLLLHMEKILGTLSVKVRLRPDYYQAATISFPCIWLIMIYFIFYYYWRYKEGHE